MGSCAHKSAALSCIAFSYAAQIQPTSTRRPSSFSYDHNFNKYGNPHIRHNLLPPLREQSSPDIAQSSEQGIKNLGEKNILNVVNLWYLTT